MGAPEPLQLNAAEGRFSRLEAISWWDQERVKNARILVIGAGALGNEVLKNLALLGVQNVVVADMDRVELSNLSRSVLFRECDEGKLKSECAARAAREIYPEMQIRALGGNVLADLGLGYFRWADAVIGALDNREARVFVNSACARVGRPWLDGGLDVLQGVVRIFNPPATACYECTMSQVDWDLLNRRRSCSLLARRAVAERGTPTTPTIASIIAALQVQEMIKLLHGMEALLGRGLVFEGLRHSSYLVNYPVDPNCPWHEVPAPSAVAPCHSDTPLSEIAQYASERLGGLDALDLSRELVSAMRCPACADRQEVFQPAERVSDVLCRKCGAEAAPDFFHSVPSGSPWLARSARQLGLPLWDMVWARHGDQAIALELGGDSPFCVSTTAEERQSCPG